MTIKIVSKPPGLFETRDPRAPDVLGFFQLSDGSFARLSTGMGIKDAPTFRVAVEPIMPGQPDRSKSLRRQALAIAYIGQLSQ